MLALTAMGRGGSTFVSLRALGRDAAELKIESHTLDNGLRVGLAQDTSRPVA